MLNMQLIHQNDYLLLVQSPLLVQRSQLHCCQQGFSVISDWAPGATAFYSFRAFLAALLSLIVLIEPHASPLNNETIDHKITIIRKNTDSQIKYTKILISIFIQSKVVLKIISLQYFGE
ncbi:hypothetical protein SS50377_28541 [Spironucleus salmonicida]|uniref:Uncharacterized protein n=1 Tax=Spironucleus salmonicida TaxID=348837 RepID=V6LB30_9EUKA|nr:hypothetical protein SS50377_28541 [Spironucleus salmonicida]|eukprot:EST41627.1 Hypothetical protein SS50377_18982 [Spironucleus salmonicida]